MKGKKILSVFLSLAMMLSLLIFGGTNFTAEELKNLATNPGFEDGTSPWVKWGGYELAEGSEARTGS
ncbi:hypothetical protein EOM86_00595, partial [Candidatus Nomurabacteria bacterium]|nr:hypothetical protein [Candidatus Nomurabacteria bacterium]